MLVLAFESTHAAMACQKLMEPLKPYMIPTPTEITADCGMSLKFEMEQAEEAMNLLEGHDDLKKLSHWHFI